MGRRPTRSRHRERSAAIHGPGQSWIGPWIAASAYGLLAMTVFLLGATHPPLRHRERSAAIHAAGQGWIGPWIAASASGRLAMTAFCCGHPTHCRHRERSAAIHGPGQCAVCRWIAASIYDLFQSRRLGRGRREHSLANPHFGTAYSLFCAARHRLTTPLAVSHRVRV